MDVEAFLNPPRPRDEVRRELGLADDDVAFGTVARLFESKGHDDILAVAPGCSRPIPKVRFVFIGDGIVAGRLTAAIERLGLRHRSTSSAWSRPAAFPSCSALDAVVHPSLREGLARVLPQACSSAARRSATTSTGPARSSCPRPASCSSPATSRASPPRILRLAADPALRAGDGPGGRRRFTDQFRHETMTSQLRSLYERLLDDRARAVAGGGLSRRPV